MASLNRSVEGTLAKSSFRSEFRAIVEVKPAEGTTHELTPGQGAGVARDLVRAVRRARDEFAAAGDVHLFLAVPASIAFMVGQQLNTFGRVQTYEHNSESDRYALAYGIASLLNNLFGKGREPFWQQAYTNLVKFVILLHKVLYDYVTLFDVYQGAINPEYLRGQDQGRRGRASTRRRSRSPSMTSWTSGNLRTFRSSGTATPAG